MRNNDIVLANLYLDGELDLKEADAFEQRLKSDPDLGIYVQGMRELTASAETLDVYKAPRVRLSGGIRLSYLKVGSRLRPFFAGAAVVAACLLVGIGVGLKMLNPPAEGGKMEAFRIVYYAPGAGSVSVLGDFNGWTGEIPLKQRGEGGYWLVELNVEPGEYRYVLMVDGKERPGDPLADYVVDDDFGSKNSVARIGL
ncbi:MAG: hypothetical protein RRA15_06345 [bacterium]|nr:hypothetical protein [bacterium]MDT8366095.1 hypothetical protein [bacterium]